jgi:hypothetical protein
MVKHRLAHLSTEGFDGSLTGAHISTRVRVAYLSGKLIDELITLGDRHVGSLTPEIHLMDSGVYVARLEVLLWEHASPDTVIEEGGGTIA